MAPSAFVHLTKYFWKKITGASFMKQIGTFNRAGKQWFSSNKHTFQIISNQPQTAYYNGRLQQVLWNKHSILDIWIASGTPTKNDTTIQRMDGCNSCRETADFFQYINAWNQEGIIISNYDIPLLHYMILGLATLLMKFACVGQRNCKLNFELV